MVEHASANAERAVLAQDGPPHIEQRDKREVTHMGSRQLAPEGASIWNPAFDVTPHRLVAGIITEKGIARPEFSDSLPQLFRL